MRGLKRNAAVVVGDVGIAEDIELLTRALDDDEPLVREHAAWALARFGRQPAPDDDRAPFAPSLQRAPQDSQ